MKLFPFVSLLVFLLFCITSLLINFPVNKKNNLKVIIDTPAHIMFHTNIYENLERDIFLFMNETKKSSRYASCLYIKNSKKGKNEKPIKNLDLANLQDNNTNTSEKKIIFDTNETKFSRLMVDPIYSKIIKILAGLNSFDNIDIKITDLDKNNYGLNHNYSFNDPLRFNLFYIDNFYYDRLNKECREDIFKDKNYFDVVCDETICTFATWDINDQLENKTLRFENNFYHITDKYKAEVANFMISRYNLYDLKKDEVKTNEIYRSMMKSHIEKLKKMQNEYLTLNNTKLMASYKNLLSHIPSNFIKYHQEILSNSVFKISKNEIFNYYIEFLFRFVHLDCQLTQLNQYYNSKYPYKNRIFYCCKTYSSYFVKNIFNREFRNIKIFSNEYKLDPKNCTGYIDTENPIPFHLPSGVAEEIIENSTKRLLERYRTPLYYHNPKIAILSHLMSNKDVLYLFIKKEIQKPFHHVEFRKIISVN